MPTNGLLSISLLPVNHLFFCSLIILCANMCSRSHLLLLKRKLVRQNEIKPKYYVLSFTIWLQASLSSAYISLITLLHMMRKMQSRAIPKKTDNMHYTYIHVNRSRVKPILLYRVDNNVQHKCYLLPFFLCKLHSRGCTNFAFELALTHCKIYNVATTKNGKI